MAVICHRQYRYVGPPGTFLPNAKVFSTLERNGISYNLCLIRPLRIALRTNILKLEVCGVGLDVNHVANGVAADRIRGTAAVRATNAVDVGKRGVHLCVLVDGNAGGSSACAAAAAEICLEDERFFL